MRSCTHSKGLPRVDLGKKEARPACVARARQRTARDKVGLGGAGRDQRAPSRGASGGESGRGGLGRSGARRDGSAGDQRQAFRHTTHNVSVLLLFFSRKSGARVNAQLEGRIRRCGRPATAFASEPATTIGCSAGGRPSISARKVRISFTTWLSDRPMDREARVIGVDLDGLVALMVVAPRGARRDDPVPSRPQGQGRHRRLVGQVRERRLVDVVARDPLIISADVVVGLEVAGEGRAESDDRAHLPRATMRELTGEHPAEAPADQQHLAPAPDLVEPSLEKLAACRPWPRYSGREARDALSSPRGRVRGEGPSSCGRWRRSRG